MSFNKKLFHLGNQVVALAMEIDKNFSSTVNDPYNERNHLKHTLVDMLDLINSIRLAIQNQEPKQWWIVKVQCNSQEFVAVKEQIEGMELNYEILKPDPEILKSKFE